MIDVPADVPPVLVALSLVSTILFGVALAVRPSPMVRAQPLAATVDTVAASEYPTVETRRITARAIRIGQHAIAVRSHGDIAHAAFSYGPVVPVKRDTALWRVLRGEPPNTVFETARELRAAIRTARHTDPVWRTGVVRLTVRRISWGEVDVTLVGA